MSTPKAPAADQTLRILSLLASSRGPQPASMIAQRLGLPRSTVYQLLQTLQEHGFAMHLPDERRYGLGIAAVELSSAYARQEPLARLGGPLVAALVDRVRLSGHLAVPHGRDVLYVIEERAPGSPSLVTGVDVRLPMPLTASGRAILAVLPKAQLRALFPDRAAFVRRRGTDDPRAPGNDGAGVEAGARGAAGAAAPARDPEIDRYSRLRAVLDETRTRGYAIERGSVTEGLASIGSPVLDHRGWPVAAIALTFPEREVDADRLPGLAAEVRAAADTLSARIHGRGAVR
ncbi:IclR family transcriptional regulator [Leucobacter allii]|uniref:IclR family transcriptional regulator n=1 Tax=Leucobacter allii TaxID=2932247 RepID=A0ABY4FP67_9MICO|nr:IclR family transcriptional regulator [Leucobacter allii]UOQ58065.1 IclR family transcriptional regulator [Leucobacter allii]